jgi:hypothetical protein
MVEALRSPALVDPSWRRRLLAGTVSLAVPSSLERAAFAMELPNQRDVARPCRPTVSCTADLAAPGTLEAEIGGFFSKLGADDRLLSFPFLLKQTLTEALQLQVGSNGYTVTRGGSEVPNERHWDNLVLGPKLHVFDQTTSLPSIAFSVQASFPVDSGGHDGAFLTAHASKDLGPLHTDFNVGLDLWWQSGAGGAAPQPFTALALSTTFLPPFGVVLEGYIFGGAEPYSSRDGGLRGAFTSTPLPWLVFDIGGDMGWFPSTHSYSLFAGMTVIPVVIR